MSVRGKQQQTGRNKRGDKANGSPASGPLLISPALNRFSLHNSEGLVARVDHIRARIRRETKPSEASEDGDGSKLMNRNLRTVCNFLNHS